MDPHNNWLPTPDGSAAAQLDLCQSVVAPASPYLPLWYADLKPSPEGQRDWLWQGYLLPGAVTLLTSLWKSGKSTLLSVLLSRLKTGGVLAGLPVRAGRAVVLSEEPRQLWWDRGLHLALDGHMQWF